MEALSVTSVWSSREIGQENQLASLIAEKSEQAIARIGGEVLPKMSQAAFISLAYDTIGLLRKRGMSWRTIRDIFEEMGYSMSLQYLQTAYSRLRRDHEARQAQSKLQETQEKLLKLEAELELLKSQVKLN
jgi:hypothetical protein